MLIVGTLVVACVTGGTPAPSAPREAAPDAPVVPTPNPASNPEQKVERTHAENQIETVRLGRYTLVELTPDEGQRDPLRQIVVITIPPAFETTLGTALAHVLNRTGYRLCSPPPSFVSLPLPASHLHLGPMTLASALQTLAGSAWSLTVDHLERRVCFVRSEER